MSENTKKEALAKVDKFMKIGYPDKWRDYSALKVAKMTCLEIQKELEFEYNRMLNKLGKPVDRTEWE
jgi:putative endopeptidase